jgi:hypothetical protein
MHEYNTSKPQVILKEYGRNLQKLAEYVVKMEDKEKRTKAAHTLIELMKMINVSGSTSQQRDSLEYQQKYWDDLYIMSNFQLDVDSPFPMPEEESIGKKPKKMEYSSNHIKYKHYGKNMELLINEAIALENQEERLAATIFIGKMMKSFYATWNKDIISDTLIVKNIEDLSKGKLTVPLDPANEASLFDWQVQQREYRPRPNNNNRNNQQNRRNQSPNQKRRRPQN